MYAGEKVDSLHNITIAKSKHTHNFFRYNILSPKKKICVCIRGISGSVNKVTAGIFDFKNNQILHYDNFDISKEIKMCFVTGENIDGLAFNIYAGIFGKTQGQELSISDFEVWEESL